MSLSWRKASASLLTLGAALLGMLLTAAASEVWIAKADHEKRIGTLEADGRNTKELLMEVRQDVKELLRRGDR